MNLETYDIEERQKRDPLAVASYSDFKLISRPASSDFKSLVMQGTVTPYCICPRSNQVLLTELPADRDLAASTFVYEAQYRHAVRVHALGIDDFVAMAQAMEPAVDPILIHSTGRCGSTLLTRALRDAAGIASFSEPDIFTQLAMAGRLSDHSRRAFVAMQAAGLRFFNRGRRASSAFKFRSAVCEHADYLACAAPGAKSIFLYRDAIEVARSYARVNGRSLSNWRLGDQERLAWSRLVPVLARLNDPVDGYLLLAALWASPVLRYLESYPDGFWGGALQYTDLVRHPNAALGALLASHSNPEPIAATVSAAVFETHSQGGSHLAPDQRRSNVLLEEELASPEFGMRIRESLSRINGRLDPQMTLPGTFQLS